ncbi:2-oxoacid:acceptor oxidoreductase family protein [Alkaliphilus hydrothermalis]|uniref:2-oxoglutarate ferredoxin oxidoreductase subunit gamma n=1 Tax=Alkaliphilus hydrothermalis TaxID=1482730 RepID=A0ABS2NMC2_9FIRM|nr:2-oxoacid:acceptor oxidoreductase family protein [Alkaliphilus hydrothermalis]MBM7614092.1 2-oxoglutarate ferredoxin oxidoreductase subunit gamma [Alkaliphilus hydrothermalis]
MNKQHEIRLSGSGGQGLILGGIILAEAALIDGNNAIQSQSYGPEARGGASKAEVIISTEEIDYPKVDKADLLLALTEVAYVKYIKSLKEGGILIVDENVNVEGINPSYRVVQIPIINTATEKIGKSMVANIIALGAIQELSNVVTKEALEKAVLKRVPRGTEELNKAALQAGYELVSK